MTSHPKTNPSLRPPAAGHANGASPRSKHLRPGFTLLEIVIVLAITALVIGGAVTTILLSSSERVLKETSSEIELLAKKARTISILHQTPYALEFHPGFIRLLPLAEAGQIERTTALGRSIGGEAVETDPTARPPVRQQINIPDELTLTLRRWNSEAFVAPTENLIHVWRFDPDGLSEPVTIRLTLGENFAQDTYHPLTATIAESLLEVQ